MTTRMLPPAEWHKLAETVAGSIWPQLPPAHAEVVVVEDGAAIVGCYVLLQVLHVECLYIAPAYRRKVAVGRALFKALRQQIASAAGAVWITVAQDAVQRLVWRHRAEPIPGAHYLLPVKESVCRLS